jgi:hypothetical protein
MLPLHLVFTHLTYTLQCQHHIHLCHSRRRDIWSGDDMAGDGRIRSQVSITSC